MGLVLWGYWPTLAEMADKWANDAHYTHGFLVPVFAGILLWLRRERLPSPLPRPGWLGVALLAAAVGLRLAGTYFFYAWFDQVSLLLALAGVCALCGGRPALGWAWPAIAFLGFMLPLPYRLESALAPALQRLATQGSVYALQTLGLCAVADGNVIHMRETTIQVVQACSGLSMLLTLFTLATGLVLVTRPPLWDKVVILLSAPLLALLVNVLRITATGVCHVTLGAEVANAVFHDLAGWLMMPLALALLWLELKLLSRLLLPPDATGQPAPLPLRDVLPRRGGGSPPALARQQSG
jgi:exosortase